LGETRVRYIDLFMNSLRVNVINLKTFRDNHESNSQKIMLKRKSFIQKYKENQNGF